MEYTVGIDEVASMTQIVNGWSFVVYPRASLKKFEEESKSILRSSKLKSFHGKNFKRKEKNYYLDFLHLVKSHATQNKGSFIGVVINSEKWWEEYRQFYLKLVSKVLNDIGVYDTNAIKIAQRLMAPLMQFQYRMNSYKFNKDDSFFIEIDTDSVKKYFDSEYRTLKIQSDLKHILDEVEVSDSYMLQLLYNSYKNKFFENTPDCKFIETRNDEDSFIIQAADMFGNFALAYIFYSLGKRSNTLEKKVEIFLSVFKDEVKDIDFTDSIALNGDDIKLKEEGLATIGISNFDPR